MQFIIALLFIKGGAARMSQYFVNAQKRVSICYYLCV